MRRESESNGSWSPTGPGSSGRFEVYGDVLGAGRNRFHFSVVESPGLDLDRVATFLEVSEAKLSCCIRRDRARPGTVKT